MGFSLSQRKTCVFPHTECMCRLQGFPLEGKDWSELPPNFKNIKFTIYPLIKCLSSPWGAPSPRILCPTFLKITFSSNFFLWREVMKSIIGSNFQAILVKIANVGRNVAQVGTMLKLLHWMNFFTIICFEHFPKIQRVKFDHVLWEKKFMLCANDWMISSD